MKALLLKDFYQAQKYCRAFLLISAAFLAVSFFGRENLFFLFYPCLMVGMIPAQLLGYDERSKWTAYSGALPYTRAQLVSAKFLIGLIAQVSVLVVAAISQAMRMHREGTFSTGEFLLTMTILLVLSCLTSSISLPFMFRWGVEKGRIAYYVMIGFVCAAMVLAPQLVQKVRFGFTARYLPPVLCLAGVGIYVLSWVLSIRFYQKREIT